jgi:pyruvate dehydrogenase E2 component (dihydrolipoamide acetyltransferase)
MPALEMAQETGKLIRWLKREGDAVAKGEPVMEVETDKVTVEIEATDSGTLGGVSAREGDEIQVGRTVAWILAPGESAPSTSASPMARASTAPTATGRTSPIVTASPVARRIAEEHGIDLAAVKPSGGRVEKADVLAYIDQQTVKVAASQMTQEILVTRLSPASPKARRLAIEHGIDLARVSGSGSQGAVLAADVEAITDSISTRPSLTEFAPGGLSNPPFNADGFGNPSGAGDDSPTGVESLSNAWHVMAERVTASWTTVPHFYLMREVDAHGLVEMRARITPAVEKRTGLKPTYTDLLVKLVAVALRDHLRLNASWIEGEIRLNSEINIGLATAIADGLIVPVIQRADQLSVGEIAAQRHDLVTRANDNKLRPVDVGGGTFTITNLGMYNVDVFNAIINAPQAAILAVGRIADRVMALNGQPVVRPMVTLSLACDHRVVDGARGAKFLDDLANLMEEPWGVLA